MGGEDHFFFLASSLSDAVMFAQQLMKREPRGLQHPTTTHRAVVIGPDLGIDQRRAQCSCSMTT